MSMILGLFIFSPDLESVAVDLVDAVGVNARGRVKSPRGPMEVHFTAGLVSFHQLANVFDELHVEAILHIDLVVVHKLQRAGTKLVEPLAGELLRLAHGATVNADS